jgi:hypothetical protein
MSKGSQVMVILAGILHGFTLFAIFVEGNTTLVGIPFILMVTVMILIWGRDKLKSQPPINFFFVSWVVGLLFIAGWSLYKRECQLPQMGD